MTSMHASPASVNKVSCSADYVLLCFVDDQWLFQAASEDTRTPAGWEPEADEADEIRDPHAIVQKGFASTFINYAPNIPPFMPSCYYSVYLFDDAMGWYVADMPPRTLADWEGILSTIEGTPFALLPASVDNDDNDELPIKFEKWVKHVVRSGQFRTVEAAAVLHVAIRDQAMRCRGLSLEYDTDAQIEFSEASIHVDRMFHPQRPREAQPQPAKRPSAPEPPVKEIRGGGNRGAPGELKDYGPVTRDRYLVECTEGNATITLDALLCRDDALAMMRFGDELGISLDMRRVKFSLVDCFAEGATCDGMITDL